MNREKYSLCYVFDMMDMCIDQNDIECLSLDSRYSENNLQIHLSIDKNKERFSMFVRLEES